MTVIYIIGGIFATWFLLCSALWFWYAVVGHKTDSSGDIGLAVIFLPLLPFIWLYGKFRGNK